MQAHDRFTSLTGSTYSILALFIIYANFAQLHKKRVIDFVRPMFVVNAFLLLGIGIATILAHEKEQWYYRLVEDFSLCFSFCSVLYVVVNEARTSSREQSDVQTDLEDGMAGGNLVQKLSFLACCGLSCLLCMFYQREKVLQFRMILTVPMLFTTIYVLARVFRIGTELTTRLSPDELTIYRSNRIHLFIRLFINGIIAFSCLILEDIYSLEHYKLHAIWHIFNALQIYTANIYAFYRFYYDKEVFLQKPLADRLKINWILYWIPTLSGTPTYRKKVKKD